MDSRPRIFFVVTRARRVGRALVLVLGMCAGHAAAADASSAHAVQEPGWQWRIGSRLQYDVARVSRHGEVPIDAGSRWRRARVGLAGEFERWLEAEISYDLARDGLERFRDAGLTIKDDGGRRLTLGHFKEPFGMERKTSVRDLPFMERSLATVLAPSRHLGVELQHGGPGWTAAAGVFGKGAEEGGLNNGRALSGRVTLAPWREPGRVLHLGLGMTHRETGRQHTVRYRLRPETRGTDLRLIDTGVLAARSHGTVGLELAGAAGPWLWQTEALRARVDRIGAPDVSFTAWYAQASVFLTGERTPYHARKATFGVVAPRHAVGQGGAGAWQASMRLSQANLNDADVRGGRQRDLTLALAWHATAQLRMMIEHVRVIRLDGGPHDGGAPALLQLRTQFAY